MFSAGRTFRNLHIGFPEVLIVVESGRRLPELTEAAVAVYRRALAAGPLDKESVNATCIDGVAAEDVEPAIQTLIELSLLSADPDTGALVPLNPGRATGIAVNEFEARLADEEVRLARERASAAALRHALAALGTEYFRLRADDDGPIQLLESGHAVRRLLEEHSIACRQDVATCQPGGPRPAAELIDAHHRDLELVRRGVRFRTLYQHSARFDGPTIDYAATLLADGGQIRTSTTLPPRMIIIDDVAFLSRGSGLPGAVMVREPSLVAFLRSVFDTAWEDSFPFQTGAKPSAIAIDAAQDKLLSLLGEGFKVAAIAKRLGVSERTCQSYLKVLFRRLGVVDRFQAGAVAQYLGLIDLSHRHGTSPRE